MVEAKEVVGVSSGIGIGVADTYLMRRYVDKKYGVKKLGRFGQVSVLVNLATGIPTLVLGVAGMFGKGPLKDSKLLKWVMSSYGTAATAGGALGVAFPVEGAYATTVKGVRQVVAGERVALRPTQIPVPPVTIAVPPVTMAVPSVEQFM